MFVGDAVVAFVVVVVVVVLYWLMLFVVVVCVIVIFPNIWYLFKQTLFLAAVNVFVLLSVLIDIIVVLRTCQC